MISSATLKLSEKTVAVAALFIAFLLPPALAGNEDTPARPKLVKCSHIPFYEYKRNTPSSQKQFLEIQRNSCPTSFYEKDSKLVKELDEDGRQYSKIFDLVLKGSICTEAVGNLGNDPHLPYYDAKDFAWNQSLESVLNSLVSISHIRGKDDECLKIIDEYLDACPLPKSEGNSASLNASAQKETDMLIGLTRNCSSACPEHGGRFCKSIQEKATPSHSAPHDTIEN